MKNIRIIEKKDYPERLSEIPDPPKKLFIRGELPSMEYKFLCVVGSRKYTHYGREACEKIIKGLRGHPIAIISGLALGIDSIAHRSALEARLPTIAFPGSGLHMSVLYPRSNVGLAEKIIAGGGALLSEFEPEFRATPYAFPQRNRLMAGLADAIVVIEAQERSGTLITARLGLDYNKDIFTIPGSIFESSRAGSNNLLKAGATPVTSGEDILRHWGMESNSGKEELISQIAKECSDKEKMVIELLHEPCSKDELIQKMHLPISEANILLSTMEIKGIITEKLGEIHIDV